MWLVGAATLKRAGGESGSEVDQIHKLQVNRHFSVGDARLVSWTMSRVLRALTAACVAMILAGCSGSDGNATTTTVLAWGDYDVGLQAKIDSMAAAKDCDGMQAEFNQIGGTNLAVRNKFGHGNEAVLTYIDAREREANCFPSATGTTVSG